MATQPPQETPVAPEPVQPTQPAPEFEAPSPDVDIPDMSPMTEPGTISAAPSASIVGHREAGDTDDIGGTDRMTSSTGGLAGTSR